MLSVLVSLVTLVAAPAVAQDTSFMDVLAPGVRHDPGIPTLEEVVGHDFHEAITHPDQVTTYLEALAAAAHDRTRLIEYARSWEGRPLHLLVIGTAERMARLEALKSDLRRLAHPDDLTGPEAERLLAELPVTVALLHSIHGNEISGAGAAMAEAYHLLAATDDPLVDRILAESLVLIDPSQNPDGRARFVAHWLQNRAFPANPDPSAAGHDEAWPGGRTNHYLFDLNRDWFAMTQPESRGKTAALLEFQPHVVADLHEMGYNSTYYFPPNAVPGNPWTTDAQEESLERIGRNIAGRFDQRGFPYFTREVFDAYYPGYGVSWPMAHGAVGMTFEQASARGLVIRRDDGSLLRYGDGVLHHALAALATLETAALNRDRLLRDFLEYRRSAARLPAAEGGPAAYVLHAAHDPAMARRLAVLLARNGIRVMRAAEPVRIAGRTLPAGDSYIVPLRQPAARLARNLLDPTTAMDEAFVRRQIERRAVRLPDEIYDITAWSLPLLWDVEAVPAERMPDVRGTLVQPDLDPGRDTRSLPAARVGYLIPWSSAGARAAAAALNDGLTVRTARDGLTIGGREMPAGTALLRAAENPADLADRLAAIAARTEAEIVPVDDGFKDAGISLGSNRMASLPRPSVLLVWDEPTRPYSAGWARYTLEQSYGVPATAIRAETLGRIRWDDYDVIVLPDGDYEDVLAPLRDRLGTWIRDGGTLITMAESSRWAARTGLLETSTELRGGAAEFGGTRPEPAPREQPIDLVEAITPPTEPPVHVPGAILNVELDTEHWLAAGSDGRIGAMVDGDRVFTPLTLDAGTNVGTYAAGADLVAGGIVWQEGLDQLMNKAFLIHQPMGRGQLIAFAEDPNYRAYAEASALLFVNAVLLGAAR